MKTDKLIYFLFQVAPEGFFLMVGREPEDARRYVVKSVELKEKSLRLDAVFEPLSENDITYFVEAQFQLDEGFYARFFSEIFLYLNQYRKVARWQSVVIYPSRSAEQKNLGAHKRLIELLEPELLRRVYLDELPSAQSAETPLGLFKLVVEPEQTAPAAAKAMIEKAPDILNVVQQILFYKFAKKSRKEVLEMLGISEEILRETKAFQEILAEGREEGIAQGLAQGLAQGRAEGRAEGLAEGELKAKLEMIPVLRELGLSDDVIAQKLKLPLDKVQSAASK